MDRQHRAIGFGAWCLVVVGVAHLLLTVAAGLRPVPPGERAAWDAMRAVPVRLLGTGHDMAALHRGFSAAMALVLIGYGLLNLAVRRLAPEAYRRGRSVAVLNAVVAGGSFAIGLVAFPLPPVLLLGAAFVAYLWVLSRPAEPASGGRGHGAAPARRSTDPSGEPSGGR